MSLIKKLFSKRLRFVFLAIVFYMLGFFSRDTLLFSKVTSLSPTPTQGVDATSVVEEVLPNEGYTTAAAWNDIGAQLIKTGAIDLTKYRETFKNSETELSEFTIFNSSSPQKIKISENNARFIVNTLWALGLVNKSIVLDEGPMRTAGNTANFASTGGWTLGVKDPMKLYSSTTIIPLTAEQHQTVKRIAENVYRPCCGNNTAFPDCNHGMAALAFIELAVSQGVSEKQIYQDLLALNSFWFPSTYVDMAVYFKQTQNTDWKTVDPKLALSQDYSSAAGSQRIATAIADTPGIQSKGGSCGA